MVGITKILEIPNTHVVAKAIELLEHSQCTVEPYTEQNIKTVR